MALPSRAGERGQKGEDGLGSAVRGAPALGDEARGVGRGAAVSSGAARAAAIARGQRGRIVRDARGCRALRRGGDVAEVLHVGPGDRRAPRPPTPRSGSGRRARSRLPPMKASVASP